MATSVLLLQALEHEWAVIASSRWSRSRLRGWVSSHPDLEPFGSIDEVLSTVRHGDTGTSRELCWVLLHLAVDDDLARRALLQAMMPALTNELKRVMLPARDHPSSCYERHDNEVEQILVTAATEAIASNAGSTSMWPMSDLVRRTHRLVIRALKKDRRWRQHNRLASTDLDGDQPAELPAVPEEPAAMVELVRVLQQGEQLQLISTEERDLIVATRCVGYGITELAGMTGAKADTLKHRRARAEAKMVAGFAARPELLEAS